MPGHTVSQTVQVDQSCDSGGPQGAPHSPLSTLVKKGIGGVAAGAASLVTGNIQSYGPFVYLLNGRARTLLSWFPEHEHSRR